jgi:multidrug efflux system membrane fusion protein
MRLLAGLLCAAFLAAILAGCSAGAEPPRPNAAPATVPVTTAIVVRKEMPLEIAVIGTVEAHATVAVRAQITGALTSVNFREGEDVKANQVIFELDRRPLEAALHQSEANLQRDAAQSQNANLIVQRHEALIKRGISSREVLDTARASAAALEATLAADRAAVENATVQLQYATIRTPISGRTGALMVHEGNLVRANDQTPLVIINQITPIDVSFAFPEALLPDLRRYMGQRSLSVVARPSNSEGPAAYGHIDFVDNAVDQTTGTIKIKGSFPNDNRQLWPGQFVNVVVRLMTEAGATVVPSLAVQTGPDGSYVYLVKADQTVEMRPVAVARVAGNETVIKDGLVPGDTVVTDGHLRLVPGSKISVRGAEAARPSS